MSFIRALQILKNILELSLLARLLLSYINFNGRNIITKFIYEITEPIVSLSRTIIHKIGLDRGMFDWSYILSLFIVRIIYILILKIIGVM